AVSGFHAALIVYPLSVRGATAPKDELGLHAGNSVVLSLVLAILWVIPIFTATVILSYGWLGFGTFLAVLAWQAQETLRRALMAHLQHQAAILGDAVSYLGQAGICMLLAQQHLLTLPLAFEVMALTSALAFLIQAYQLRIRVADRTTLS